MTSQSDLNLCNAVCMYACITAYKGISTEYNKVLTVFYRFTTTRRGGWVVRLCWVNVRCRGVLLIWLIVGQGLAALALGAGGGCLDISIFSLLFLPLFGRRFDID